MVESTIIISWSFSMEIVIKVLVKARCLLRNMYGGLDFLRMVLSRLSLVPVHMEC